MPLFATATALRSDKQHLTASKFNLPQRVEIVPPITVDGTRYHRVRFVESKRIYPINWFDFEKK